MLVAGKGGRARAYIYARRGKRVKLPTSDMLEACDVKPSTSDVPEPSGVPEELKKVMQQFSGFQNCTFHFYTS